MRTLIILPYLLLLGTPSNGAEDPVKLSAELLAALPNQSVLSQSKEIMKPGNTASAEEKKSAATAISKAKLIIPQLRKLITVGRSVFDYPGLLGRGTIKRNDPSYSLYMGVYLLSHEGSEPFDMRITFDSTGKILSVEDVFWRN